MTPRAKGAVLWGLVGALSFLVLAQGYVLLGGRLPVGLLGRLGVGAVVGVVATGATYLAAGRLARKEQG
ncbi:hypothetical protein RYH80_10165 [Halobaculum sp. MBLA0147]|uniref:hypothetical protein n=1 Tax=Halobaculum sp. MBLA0147 TaxID=3079934 RepID=UPI003525E15E